MGTLGDWISDAARGELDLRDEQIATLQSRLAAAEAERDKVLFRERQWESMLKAAETQLAAMRKALETRINPMISAVLHHCQAEGALDRSYICDCLNVALKPAGDAVEG